MDDAPKIMRYRWFIWVCAMMLLGVMLLSLLPEMLRMGAQQWLRDHGALQAQIDDIDFNPFTGSIALIGLHAGDGMQVKRLTLQMDWLPLWHQIIMIRSLYLHGGRLDLRQNKQGEWQIGDIRLRDDVSATGASVVADKPWQIAPADVQLSDIDLHLVAGMEDTQRSLSLPLELLMLHLQQTDTEADRMSLRVQTGPVVLTAAGYQLAYTMLDSDGYISLASGQPDLLAGLMSGTLQIGLNDVSLKDEQGQSLASLASVAVLDLGVGADNSITAGSVHLGAVRIAGKWADNGEITATAVKLQDLQLPTKGVISVASLSLDSVVATGISGGAANLAFDGLHAQKLTVEPGGATALGKLEVVGISADKLPNSAHQMHLQQLQAESLIVDAARKMRLDSLQLAGLRLDRPAKADPAAVDALGMASLTLQRLQARQLKADTSGAVDFSSLQLDGVKADQLSDSGDVMVLQQLQVKTFAIDAAQQMQLASLRLSGLKLNRQANDMKLAAIDRISLDGLSMAGSERGRFDTLAIDGLILPSSGQRKMGRIGSVKVEGADLNQGNYHVKRLHLGGMDVYLSRQSDGSVALIDQLAGKQLSAEKKAAAKPAGKAAAGKEGAAPRILIDELVLDKGSRITVRDESVSPAFDTRLVIEKMHVAPLDLSGKRTGSLDAQLKLVEAGQLIVTGEVRPGPVPAAQLNISLKRFKIPVLSGYVEPDFGKSIRTGQLDLDSRVHIADGHIDAANKLLIRSLTLGDSDQPGKATQGLTMPLSMSLDMLRDGRGDIALDVPVKGLLDDPNINIHDIINKALLSSLSSGAMTYAALVLQPYGSILVAANLASGLISDAAKPRLTPIIFEPQSSALTTPMAEYAGKIAGLMKEKGLRLQICGVAIAGEGGAVAAPEQASAMRDQQLLQLATQRSDHVQEAIASHGVATDQLFGCRPQIDAAKSNAQPRVELLLD